jgi:hypothetical protein
MKTKSMNPRKRHLFYIGIGLVTLITVAPPTNSQAASVQPNASVQAQQAKVLSLANTALAAHKNAGTVVASNRSQTCVAECTAPGEHGSCTAYKNVCTVGWAPGGQAAATAALNSATQASANLSVAQAQLKQAIVTQQQQTKAAVLLILSNYLEN